MLASITQGLRAAAKHPKLVAVIWAWYALLSLIPAMPAYAWLSGSMGSSPAAASALQRFDFGLLGELSNYNQTNPLSLLVSAMMAGGIVAFVSSAFVMGGILEVLGSDGEARSFMHRFYRGGGHFFWRFFRLSLLACVGVLLVGGVVAATTGAITAPMSNTEWEPGGYLAGFLTFLSVALVAAFFLLGLDYARIRTARDGSRGMLRTYASSLGFVLRHVFSAYVMGLVFVALLAGVVALYVAYETNSPAAATSSAIAVIVVFQQVAVLARVFMRVGLVGAERHFFMNASPVPVVVSAPAPVAAPVIAVASEAVDPSALTPRDETSS